jgi:hypothetical protein
MTISRKGRSQAILICTHDFIPKRPKKFHPKLDTINCFNKSTVYKISLQKLVAFLYANNEQTEKEYWKTTPFTVASK